MGHVDDAHHAEGDGEPDGGKQQHGAERQAVQRVLDGVQHGQTALDRRRCAFGRELENGRAALLDSAEKCQGVLVPPFSNHVDRCDLICVGYAILEDDSGGSCLRQRLLDLWVGLLRERSVQGRKRAGVPRLDHSFGGRKALDRVGVHQRERTQSGFKCPAYTVVEADRLEAEGLLGWGDPGAGVEIFAVGAFDKHALIRRVEEPAIGKSLERSEGPRTSRRSEVNNAGFDLGKLLGGHPRESGIGVLSAKGRCSKENHA